jgi:hypothetical protein
MWRMPGRGSVTSWTERSGEHGAACQLVGIRQRAGAGGRWLGYGPACFYAGGQRPAAGQVRLGVWAGVAAHLAVGGGGGGSSGPCWPSSWPAVGGCRPFPAAVLPGRGPSWWRSIRWPPAAASGSQWPAWRSPAATRAGSFVPFRWRSGRWAGQAVPQARSSMVRDGRGGNRWRATRAPGQHGARLAE